jgi:CRISPR-associated protein Cas1
MLAGRLGLETARIPHADRHGLIWFEYGNLVVQDGTLHFIAAKSNLLDAGDYCIPFQMLSLILLGPGTTISHDALRLMARHGTALVAVGEGGARMYSAQPLGPNESALARQQARCWADAEGLRLHIARRMYAIRLGEIMPNAEIAVLRGIEGVRMKEFYLQIARKYGIAWAGRRYDRSNPGNADLPNQAINHAATAVESAAHIAVAATGTLPQLGFIHEDSFNAFCLDIADLYRHTVVLPLAFESIKQLEKEPSMTIDRCVRRRAVRMFSEKDLIPKMIDCIKQLFDKKED